MKKTILSTTGLLLAALLFLGFNILAVAGLKSVRIDLTENRLYTLSQGTLNLLSGLQAPIKLRLYFSKKLASDAGALTSYAQRVQELLEQYVSRSHGQLSLEVIDPQPYTEEEDRAVGFGLQGVPVSAGGEMLYFGLAGTNSTDKDAVIPFIQENKEESLEYDVTKLVYTLSNPRQRVIGLLTKLPMEGNPMARFQDPNADVQAWAILEPMRQLFEVRTVPATAEKIDADIDVLMVAHPQGLSQRTLWAIDQYVLGGGKVLAFIDPYCESQQVRQDPSNPMSAMMANRTSDLGPLLAAWGLEMSAEDLAGDRESAMRVGYNGLPVDYILYLGLRGEKACFAKDDFVTGKLELVNLATAGVLKKKEGATTTVTPLLQTTKQSMRVNRSSVLFGADPTKVLESFVSGNESLMVAARISGPVKSAFPDGKPKAEKPEDGAEKPEEKPAESLKESKGPVNLIVVADCDVLEDHFWMKSQSFFGQRIPIPIANNGDFVINALDNLSGSNDLISLRSRGRFNRPFERVAEIRRAADTHFGQKVKELEDKLKDAETRINELQGQKDAKTSLILSPEQQKEVERFREERTQTRKELRAIKHDRDKDIEALGSRLKFANILLIPFLLVVAVCALTLVRASRAKAAAGSVGPRS
jgi:ABC-type uncharacterized transport system involved in gliding motility auxiliary subunit